MSIPHSRLAFEGSFTNQIVLQARICPQYLVAVHLIVLPGRGSATNLGVPLPPNLLHDAKATFTEETPIKYLFVRLHKGDDRWTKYNDGVP